MMINMHSQSEQEEQLVQKVHRELEQDMETLGLDINITARDKEITLTGVVDWLAEKEQAEALASRVEGVGKVENALTLSMDGQLTDNDMEVEISERLEAAQLTNLGVKVHKGIVTMVGHCDKAEEERAQDLIAHVRGIKEIVSRIEHG